MKQKYILIKNGSIKVIEEYEIFLEAKQYGYTDYELDAAKDSLLSNGYLIDTLGNALKNNITKEVITNGNDTFDSVELAAKWCIEQHLTSTSIGRVIANLKRNIDGNTKSAYGYNFSRISEKINIDNYQIV